VGESCRSRRIYFIATHLRGKHGGDVEAGEDSGDDNDDANLQAVTTTTGHAKRCKEN
jgi:hypothetical protein